MAQSRTPVYLGLAGLGAGAFYLYRAGGDPKTATQELKGVSPSFGPNTKERRDDANVVQPTPAKPAVKPLAACAEWLQARMPERRALLLSMKLYVPLLPLYYR